MGWPHGKAGVAGPAAMVMAGALVLAACGSSGTAAPAAAPSQPAPSSPPGQQRSPFTGEPVSALKPVLAVKIDNIVLARPQTGFNQADLVYVLPVEGGLSRFLVVFSSHLPPVIGPVRSAREDDLELLRQFGRPGLRLLRGAASAAPGGGAGPHR